jgi:hypothetical protein
VEQQAPEFTMLIEDDEDKLDAFHNESIDNNLLVPGQTQRVLAPGRRGRLRRVQDELQFIAGGSEPRTFTEAEQDQA